MSEAVELYKKQEDGTVEPCGIFYCSECRVVHRTKSEAEWCHGEHLCACGKKITHGNYQRQCHDCDSTEWKEKERKKEAERFEKATKITEAEYNGGMIYGPDDEYYTEIEDLIDNYLEGQEPEYVWACKNVGVMKANTESLYENMLENMWEDASVDDLRGVDELEAAVTAFNEANKGIEVWQVDYSTAILISPRTLNTTPRQPPPGTVRSLLRVPAKMTIADQNKTARTSR